MPALVQTITTYTIPEAAAKVGVSRMTLWRDVEAGKLPAQKNGRNFVIFAADLLEYVLAYRGGKGIAGA